MELHQRINAFSQLGKYMQQLIDAPYDQEFIDLLNLAKAHNGWFVEKNITHSLQSWADQLSNKNITKWLANYIKIEQTTPPKTIALVMAGNIPLVGFHDYVSVLLTGNKVLAKLSSNDKVLLPFLTKKLIEIEPSFNNYIDFTDKKLEGFDAVIATGSNNTARYFDYYFGKYPHIIRKNRNSVAILTGEESTKEMEALANDIFSYFGLGCRNVSKIYVPKTYDWDVFFNAMFAWKEIIHNHKYINNYDYNKAVYLMSNIKLLDNEYMLLKEDTGFSSPIAVVFYEHYTNLKELEKQLTKQEKNIQCIVSKNHTPFGKAQTPALWDYADGVDTIAFLLSLQ